MIFRAWCRPAAVGKQQAINCATGGGSGERNVARKDLRSAAVYGHLIVFLVILGWSLSCNQACLLYHFDGNQWQILFDVQREFRTPFAQVGADPLQGNFDTYFPAFREYLLPHFLALLSGLSNAGKAASYSIYASFLTFSAYVLSRSIGIGRGASVLSGVLVPFLILPSFVNSGPLLYPLFQISPQIAQGMALVMLILACLWSLEKQVGIRELAILIAPAALTVAAAVSLISLTVLMVPTLAVYGIASLLSAPCWRRVFPRVASGVLIIAVLTGLGIAKFGYSLSAYAAFNFFANELIQDRANLYFASSVYAPGYAGILLQIIGLAGALRAAKRGDRRLRTCAVAYMTSTIVFQVVAYVTVAWADGYHGPSPLYFEIFFFPFAAIFASYAAYAAIDAVAQVVPRVLPVRGGYARQLILHSGLAATTIYLLLWNFSSIAAGSPKICTEAAFASLRPTSLTEHLAKEIAQRPGEPFRGMVATFTGYRDKPSVTWFDLIAHDAKLAAISGNDHRTIGLWKYRIPTLIQYNTYISPQYYVLFTRLLDRPRDRQLRSIVFATRPNEPILALWGVRYLITDFAPLFGTLRFEMPVTGQEPLRLVELRNANVGNYSPTEIVEAKNFRGALTIMSDTNFDGQRTVVTMSPLVGPLVRASDGRLVLEKYGFRVHAKSAGRSVLVLPVQYSHCWRITSRSGDVHLFRANFAQLGIEFHGDLEARLRLRYGPIFAGDCRLADLEDMEKLDIRSVDLVPAPVQ
jgi:hypothetical protein